jgi:hypothetical protein
MVNALLRLNNNMKFNDLVKYILEDKNDPGKSVIIYFDWDGIVGQSWYVDSPFTNLLQ